MHFDFDFPGPDDDPNDPNADWRRHVGKPCFRRAGGTDDFDGAVYDEVYDPLLPKSQKVKKCTVCEEFPSVCMLCGVCQNGGFRRDTNVETSTVFLVALRNGVLQRYELVYQLGSADSECSYFGYLGAWSHQ